ncbi:RIP metalloprotease RseP [Yoonia sp. SS1-5]|uniref:Zinc metalloprotease n=1 Tax=Yoonia rhodophyticola TaxID=3137370 RepID=A0AAN0M652_9RHOB
MIDVIAIIFGLLLTFLCVVLIHELGHYLAARLVGVQLETFSVGFGRPLWSRVSPTGVRWQIAAVPVGGYVRFVGDENAASLSSMPEGPVVPGSLRAASKTRQAIVVLAGPLANLILTFALLSVVPLISGQTAWPWVVDDLAISEDVAALRPGDQIIAVNGTAITEDMYPTDLAALVDGRETTTYALRRDGIEMAITGPRPDVAVLAYVAPGTPAETAGLQAGDRLLSIDGVPLPHWAALQNTVAASEGRTLQIDADRDGQFIAATLNPELTGDRWLIGVSGAPLFTLVRETPSLGAALSSGAAQTSDLLTGMVVGLSASAVGRGDPCALDGPVAIGAAAGQAIQLGPVVFLTFMAVISLGLGLLNLLPIPILDGGHLLTLGVEAVTGRPMGKRVQAVLFIGGVTLLVFLMLTATINDLRC